MRPKQWDNISDEAKELVKSMIAHDANMRPTAGEALKHSWLQVGGYFAWFLLRFKAIWKQYFFR